MITPITQITPLVPKPVDTSENLYDRSKASFLSIFTAAIDNVRKTDAEVVQTEYLMATGQLDNPAALTIAETKSELAVNLLVQMRNKALEAYNELARINM